MEQKQLDDMEDSFFGDEFIEEEVQISPVKQEKTKKKADTKKVKRLLGK